MWEDQRTRIDQRSHLVPLPAQVPSRVIIEGVHPEIDGGRFPIKRTVGEEVVVTADVHADGHDTLAAVLRYRPAGATDWEEVALTEMGNDRWLGRFTVTTLGRWEYTLEAWIDHFASWRKGLSKKVAAGQDVTSELFEGSALLRETALRAPGADAAWLQEQAEFLERDGDPFARAQRALDP